jgi:hypothetical protein
MLASVTILSSITSIFMVITSLLRAQPPFVKLAVATTLWSSISIFMCSAPPL